MDETATLTPLSDEALMGRVRSGELSYAGLLFERYQRPIYQFLWRTLRDHHLAEDAAQSVFVRLLRYRGSYREGASFRAWIYGIAVNERRRAGARRGAGEEVPWSEAEVIPVDTRGEEALAAAQDRETVQRCLAQLPPERRELLSLYLWDELAYAELAEIYKVSVAALRVRVHRALTALRERIAQQGGRR